MRVERVEGSHIRLKLIKNDFDKFDSRTQEENKSQPTRAPDPWLEICVKKGNHFPILLGTENWEGQLKKRFYSEFFYSVYSVSATLRRSKALRNTR